MSVVGPYIPSGNPEWFTYAQNMDISNIVKNEQQNIKGGGWRTKWEAAETPSYLISINGFTGDPRGARKSLHPGFTLSPLWKNERNRVVYGYPSGFYGMFY